MDVLPLKPLLARFYQFLFFVLEKNIPNDKRHDSYCASGPMPFFDKDNMYPSNFELQGCWLQLRDASMSLAPLGPLQAAFKSIYLSIIAWPSLEVSWV